MRVPAYMHDRMYTYTHLFVLSWCLPCHALFLWVDCHESIFFSMTTSMLSCLHVYTAFHILSHMTRRLHQRLDTSAHFWTSRINLPIIQIKQWYMKASYGWTGLGCLTSLYPNSRPSWSHFFSSWSYNQVTTPSLLFKKHRVLSGSCSV